MAGSLESPIANTIGLVLEVIFPRSFDKAKHGQDESIARNAVSCVLFSVPVALNPVLRGRLAWLLCTP